MGSQSKRLSRDDVDEENFLDLHTTRASEFCTLCRREIEEIGRPEKSELQ